MRRMLVLFLLILVVSAPILAQTIDFKKLEINYLKGGKYFYKGKPYTGKAVRTGILKEEMEFKNGLLNGQKIIWSRDGKNKSRISNYQAGQLHGLDTFFDMNGQTLFEHLYKNGELDGKQTDWWRFSKNKKCEKFFKGGDPTGKWTAWDRNGSQIAQIDFSQKSGEYFDLTEQDKKSNAITCRNGQVKWISYYANKRQILSEKNYLNGKKHGLFKFYFENGKLEQQKSYKNGLRDGKMISWYENGKTQFQEEYKNGKKHGKFIEWDEQGNVEFEEVFKNGRLVEEKWLP